MINQSGSVINITKAPPVDQDSFKPVQIPSVTKQPPAFQKLSTQFGKNNLNFQPSIRENVIKKPKLSSRVDLDHGTDSMHSFKNIVESNFNPIGSNFGSKGSFRMINTSSRRLDLNFGSNRLLEYESSQRRIQLNQLVSEQKRQKLRKVFQELPTSTTEIERKKVVPIVDMKKVKQEEQMREFKRQVNLFTHIHAKIRYDSDENADYITLISQGI